MSCLYSHDRSPLKKKSLTISGLCKATPTTSASATPRTAFDLALAFALGLPLGGATGVGAGQRCSRNLATASSKDDDSTQKAPELALQPIFPMHRGERFVIHFSSFIPNSICFGASRKSAWCGPLLGLAFHKRLSCWGWSNTKQGIKATTRSISRHSKATTTRFSTENHPLFTFKWFFFRFLPLFLFSFFTLGIELWCIPCLASILVGINLYKSYRSWSKFLPP